MGLKYGAFRKKIMGDPASHPFRVRWDFDQPAIWKAPNMFGTTVKRISMFGLLLVQFFNHRDEAQLKTGATTHLTKPQFLMFSFRSIQNSGESIPSPLITLSSDIPRFRRPLPWIGCFCGSFPTKSGVGKQPLVDLERKMAMRTMMTTKQRPRKQHLRCLSVPFETYKLLQGLSNANTNVKHVCLHPIFYTQHPYFVVAKR